MHHKNEIISLPGVFNSRQSEGPAFRNKPDPGLLPLNPPPPLAAFRLDVTDLSPDRQTEGCWCVGSSTLPRSPTDNPLGTQVLVQTGVDLPETSPDLHLV